MVKMASIGLLLALTTSYDLEVKKMDVKTTFLHSELKEEIFMKQLEGFVVEGREEMVCQLNRSLYGLKQSIRQWYQWFDTHVVGQWLLRSEMNRCVYFKQECLILLFCSYMLMILFWLVIVRS